MTWEIHTTCQAERAIASLRFYGPTSSGRVPVGTTLAWSPGVVLVKTSVAERKPKRRRSPSVDRLIKQAERSGKRVTSITTATGETLRFDDPKPDSTAASPSNPWDEVLKRESD